MYDSRTSRSVPKIFNKPSDCKNGTAGWSLVGSSSRLEDKRPKQPGARPEDEQEHRCQAPLKLGTSGQRRGCGTLLGVSLAIVSLGNDFVANLEYFHWQWR